MPSQSVAVCTGPQADQQQARGVDGDVTPSHDRPFEAVSADQGELACAHGPSMTPWRSAFPAGSKG